MLAQLLRPLRNHCNRLIATSVGTKSTGDSEHYLFASSDVAFVEPEPSTSLCVKRDEEGPKLLGRFSRWLSKSIATQLAIENEPHYMVAPGDGEFYIPEPTPAVSPAIGSFNGFAYGGVANLPVAWPSQNVSSWTDMRLYQAPMAAYQQVEVVLQPVGTGICLAQTGSLPSTAILMQPMIMPIFYPYGSLQMPNGMVQPAPDAALPADATQPDTQQCEAPAAAPRPRHRRSRRGGAAARKKHAAAAQSDEVDEATRSVQETTQACSTPTSQGSSDPEVKDGQSLSTDAGTAETADVDSMTDGSVHSEKASEGTVPAGRNFQAAPAKDAPLDDGDSNKTIDPMIAELCSPDETRRQLASDWVSKSFWPLALTKRGCRILQNAIEVGTPAYQQQLLANMHGQVEEAMQSPHANHVLQKFIEIMPAERTQFVLTELQDQVLSVARHRFGCRILQRLVEHCAPQQTENIIETILSDSASLCRHQYGNYVLQHILQHGSPSQRSVIADVVQKDIIRLSKHRVASHVVSSAMVHCPAEDVQRLTHSVLHDAGQLAELSRREYGSFVVREVNRAARLIRVEQ